MPTSTSEGTGQGAERVSVDNIIVEERIRKDYGDIDELANSINRLGIIQPIVLSHDMKLIVGGRRLCALTKLGVKELIHAAHFIWTEEVDELRIKAIEAEENIKRKELTWQETVLAKKRLLDLMVLIHGPATGGRPTRSEHLGISSSGFGINRLAALLGESNAQTSKDIELAELITNVPSLAKAETKEAARRQVMLATTVAAALQQQKLNPPKVDAKWTLYEGDFLLNVSNIEPSSIDLVLTDPPYGEDTQGMGPNSKQLLAGGFADSLESTRLLYFQLASEAWRVLRPDRFCAFFFGFSLYTALVEACEKSGFSVDPSPLIWVKNTVINTDPYRRYGRSYEPILIARKGQPKLMRIGRDVLEVTNVTVRGIQDQKFYHAQKPVELMERLILDLCVPSGTVVDFCAGSGSTGVGALRTGRRAILFERDAAAIAIIKSRLGAL